jgi:hemoglobin-like flavoprotein
MERQRGHLAAALSLIVRNLSILGALERPLGDLGAAHARVGVRREHYPVVCDAMLATLAEALPDLWTPELAADWAGLLSTVAGYMVAGQTTNAT